MSGVKLAALAAVLAVSATFAATASAHEGHQEGAVAYCNWENYRQYGHGGLNWRWVACNHTLHTGPPGEAGEYHSQWRGGLGTPGHTVDAYKREAAAFRAYTGAGR